MGMKLTSMADIPHVIDELKVVHLDLKGLLAAERGCYSQIFCEN
jgi:hypothetical protein